MNLIKWAKEHKIWVGIIVIILVLLPILIVHSLFKITAPCNWLVANNWTAGDVLVYIGEVLGAVATISAIILTIIFTQENQKNERKLSIKPHLHAEHQPIFKTDRVKEQVANRAIFIVFPLNESENVTSSYEPPYILTKSNEDQQKDPIREILTTLDFCRKYYVLQYTISNVGAGNALNLIFKINDKPVIQPFSLTVNNTKTFVVLFKAELLDKPCSIQFKYDYQDVASIARYEQQETIVLFREDNSSLNISQQIDKVLSQPKEN